MAVAVRERDAFAIPRAPLDELLDHRPGPRRSRARTAARSPRCLESLRSRPAGSSRGCASRWILSNGRMAAAEAASWSSVRLFIGRILTAISRVMEGIISAWGRILTGYTPALSIEITRECPLRCPGCYAYGDDHLGGDLTLRQVRDFKGQALIDGVSRLVDQHQAAAPVDRRRRTARALPRAEHAAADAGRRAASTYSSSPAPCAKSRRSGMRSAPAVDRRLDRRPAAGARCAPHAGHLRSDPEAHRRPLDHGALHGDAPAGRTARAISKSSCSSGRRSRKSTRSG